MSMDIQKKRGKWSKEEDAIIINGIKDGHDSNTILQFLTENDKQGRGREITTLERRIKHHKVDQGTQTIKESNEDQILELKSKSFYPALLKMYTDEELELFQSKWVELYYGQFRADILPSEEIQLKNLINIVILINRGMADRKDQRQAIEDLQKEMDAEYDKPDGMRDMTIVGVLQPQISQLKTSEGAFTAEYEKLVKQQTAILKDLKANREARVKRFENSNESWTGLMRAIEEDKTFRDAIYNESVLMRMAKEVVEAKLSQWHTYTDGNIDQPLLTSKTVKAE